MPRATPSRTQLVAGLLLGVAILCVALGLIWLSTREPDRPAPSTSSTAPTTSRPEVPPATVVIVPGPPGASGPPGSTTPEPSTTSTTSTSTTTTTQPTPSTICVLILCTKG